MNHDSTFWIDELDGVAKNYPYRHVLDIFVRVNSGGTKLTAGDLMFAAMKEGWEDVETRIEQTLDLLNGGRLSIDSDLVLKALSLAHGEGAEITTGKFEGQRGADLLKKMEESWDRSEQAFHELRDFMVHGLRLQSNRVVRSYNALIPLFVYLFLHPKPSEPSRVRMAAYFHKAQLFGWFGSQTDSTLNVLTGIVQKETGADFPLASIEQYFQERRLARVELTETNLWDARLRPLFLNIVYSQAFGESPFDVSFKGNEPHVDHIYPQYMLRSKLGCGSREINDIGNLRFVGATDNIRKRAELPASYFARLKVSGIPVERHLLVKDFASDPSRLLFDAETFAAASGRSDAPRSGGFCVPQWVRRRQLLAVRSEVGLAHAARRRASSPVRSAPDARTRRSLASWIAKTHIRRKHPWRVAVQGLAVALSDSRAALRRIRQPHRLPDNFTSSGADHGASQ